MKLFALVLVAAFVPGGSIVFLMYLRKRASARETARLASLIKAPRRVFVGQDDALRLRTQARRTAADAIRARAAHVESGAPVSAVLRRVK